MNRNRKSKSRRWHQRHEKDPFVKKSREAGYRSRAVWKLEEIDRGVRLIGKGQRIVDLGAAPGGWSQYAAARVGTSGQVVAVDRLAFDPVDGVEQLIGDVTEPGIRSEIVVRLEGGLADLVLSDMAPNLTGVASTDQANATALAEIALVFAAEYLQPRGKLLVKLFEGSDLMAFRRRCDKLFAKVKVIKPKASRSNSREIYLLAECPTEGAASAESRSLAIC